MDRANLLKTIEGATAPWDVAELLEKLHPNIPCRGVDVIWAVRHEMARRVEDVLSRRNRSLLLGAAASMEIAPRVASLMANELGFDSHWEAGQVEAFRRLASQDYMK